MKKQLIFLAMKYKNYLLGIFVILMLLSLVNNQRNAPDSSSNNETSNYIVTKGEVQWRDVVPGETGFTEIVEKLGKEPDSREITKTTGTEEIKDIRTNSFGFVENAGNVFVWTDSNDVVRLVKNTYVFDENRAELDRIFANMTPDISLYIICDQSKRMEIYKSVGIAGDRTVGSSVFQSIYYFEPGNTDYILSLFENGYSITPPRPGECESY